MANTSGPQANIGNGQTMNVDAAAYYNALTRHIFEASGLVILPTEGTRAYARQKELYDGYRLGLIDPTTGRRYNPAWNPDDARAYHLSGRAVDVGSYVGYKGWPQYEAFRRFAGAYGFRETVKGEPWHFEWRREWATVVLDGATTTSGGTPIEFESEEDDMFNETDRAILNNLTAMLALDAGPTGKGGIRQTINATYDILKAQVGRFALVRAKGRPEVFLSVDRQSLRWLESEQQLADQRYTLGVLGATNLPVQEVDNLAAFGAIGTNERPADSFYANL